MEAPTIHVDIVSAEGELFSGPAAVVFALAMEGDLVIYPRHAPLLTLLKPGEVRVQTPDGAEHHFFVGGGALEVQPTKVTVLADTALRARDIDAGAARAPSPHHPVPSPAALAAAPPRLLAGLARNLSGGLALLALQRRWPPRF